MLKRILLLVSAALCAACLSYPASADPTADGATIDDVEAALGVGLDVRRSATDRGVPFIMAKGKFHTIAAYMIHCGQDTRCKGVRYFSILDKKPSPSLMNSFNNKFHYSKISLDEDGDAIITLEQHVGGGVTSKNLLQNALVLMVRMTMYQEILGKVASMGVQTAPLTDRNLGAAMAEQALTGPRQGASFAIEPALLNALKANVLAAD